MNFITNTLEQNMIIVLSYYSQTQTVWFMKLKHYIYEDFYENKMLFDLVTIEKIQNVLILSIKKWLVK